MQLRFNAPTTLSFLAFTALTSPAYGAKDYCEMLPADTRIAIRSGAQSTISITEFGVNGNDSVNDYAALKAAALCLSAKWPEGKGLTVTFPSGVYIIDDFAITGKTRYVTQRYPNRTANGSNGIGSIVFSRCSNLHLQGEAPAGAKRPIIRLQGEFTSTRDVALKPSERVALPGEDIAYRSYVRAISPMVFSNCTDYSVDGFEIDGGARKSAREAQVALTGSSSCLISTGGSRYKLSNLFLHHCTGDGLLIGGAGGCDPATLICQPERHIILKNVVAARNARNGLAITNARDVRVIDSSFTHTANTGSKRFKGQYPGAGIDVEPNYSTKRAKNCLLPAQWTANTPANRKCPTIVSQRTGNIRINNNKFKGNRWHDVMVCEMSGPIGSVTVNGNSVEKDCSPD